MAEDTEDFADLLGRYLKHAGLTQQELATQIGMHRNTVVGWMNRTSRPKLSGQVLRIANALFLSKEERQALFQAANFPVNPVQFWSTEVWTVPQSRDTFFTGREAIFESLRTLLIPGSTTGLTQAISGLGGVGKTHTAVEYAYRFHQEYEAVIWLQAESWETLVSGCISLAKELALPEHKEADQTIAAVQRWLRQHRHWLLILDNVDAEQAQELIKRFVPTGHQGCVLITTRMHTLEPFAQSLVLPIMSAQEGILFLLRRTGKIAKRASLEQASQAQQEEARLIWELVEGLPLALDQAGAFLVENNRTFLEYYERYRQRRQELLDRRGRRILGHDASVATTFSLAFERVQTLSPIAAELLQACAFLASEAIPDELFYGEVGSMLLGHVPENLDIDEAVGVLHGYSLVQRNTETKTLSIHRLVQAVIQGILEKEEHHQWVERVVLAVNAAFPHAEHRNWSECTRLLLQALTATQLIEQYHIMNEEAGRLVYETAVYLRDHARYDEALHLMQHALAIFEQQKGTEHLVTARSINGLASLYWELGRYHQAEPLFQRALTIFEQQLGTENIITANCLNNLGLLYYRWGRYDKAEPFFQRARTIHEQQLGGEHPSTAGSFINLALLYDSWGKYRKAETLYKQALAIYQKVYGSDHRDTAMSLISLAELHREQGKYGEVEPLLVSARSIFEKAFESKDHPHIALCLHLLASLKWSQGKYDEAEPFFQRALTIRKQQLGGEHPSTATSFNSLGDLYLAQGRYQLAESPLLDALKIREKQLGPDHPDVASSLNSLASLRLMQKRYQEVEPLLQRALSIFEQQLGREHPYQAISINSLANLYRMLGKYAEADPLYHQALSLREHALGLHHPDTAETLHGLATLRISQSNLEEAVPLYQRALAIREHVFGSQNPKTSETRKCLRDVLMRMGRMEEAARLDEVQPASGGGEGEGGTKSGGTQWQ